MRDARNASVGLDPAEVDRVLRLIEYLLSRPCPDEQTLRARSRESFDKVWSIAAESGVTLGEAGLWRGTAIGSTDKKEFSEQWNSIADNLSAHATLVEEGVDALHESGLLPPPASVRRMAIILRRAKRTDLEARLLRAWIAGTPRGASAAYEDLLSRLAKLET